MIASLYKEFAFEAAHSLPHLPAEHKCSRVHGHSYRVRVWCRGPIDLAMGWVVDYADISAAVAPLIERLDHQNLNEITGQITTAENIAVWLMDRLHKLPYLWRVGVSETSKTWVYVEV